MMENYDSLDDLHELQWYDDREAEDMKFDLERDARKTFVEPVYRSEADLEKLCQSCEPQCRRLGRCCYLRTGRRADDALQPVGYNLRVRFMPLCLARNATEESLDELRRCVDAYLK